VEKTRENIYFFLASHVAGIYCTVLYILLVTEKQLHLLSWAYLQIRFPLKGPCHEIFHLLFFRSKKNSLRVQCHGLKHFQMGDFYLIRENYEYISYRDLPFVFLAFTLKTANASRFLCFPIYDCADQPIFSRICPRIQSSTLNGLNSLISHIIDYFSDSFAIYTDCVPFELVDSEALMK
jgi:hypothetical protein